MNCELCGCDDEHACFLPGFGSCAWVAPNLCSHCELKAFYGLLGPLQFVRPERDELVPHHQPIPFEALLATPDTSDHRSAR